MKKVLIYYNFIIIGILIITGFVSAQNQTQLLSAYLFFPLLIYFGIRVIPRKNRAMVFPGKAKRAKDNKSGAILTLEEPEKVAVLKKEGVDFDRRMFLKLIGSAGLSVFMLSVFTKKAQAAFFGSTPGPGTVAIKNIAGEKIDPAEKQPTDGYKIAQLDDSIPAFYGFTKKGGAWFIMKEDATGAYRYARGNSDFETNWGNRADEDEITYDYYENVFL